MVTKQFTKKCLHKSHHKEINENIQNKKNTKIDNHIPKNISDEIPEKNAEGIPINYYKEILGVAVAFQRHCRKKSQ